MIASSSEKIRDDIVGGLRGIGYRGELLAENYKFLDWFSPKTEVREVIAAAFSQTPISYDSACIGIVHANGVRGAALIDRHRALGAPVILEIDGDKINEWAVARKKGEHGLIEQHSVHQINNLFARRTEWEPREFLRAKNIGDFKWSQQLELFSGLLPELEEQIQEKMAPLLQDALSTTQSAYRNIVGHKPDGEQLFQLVFWLLTAKVFHDRQVGKFAEFDAASDVDEMLRAVADQYKKPVPRLLNKESRSAAASRIWRDMDFRNLSVEVLSQIWSSFLVDDETKKKLGIHRTPRTIVRYIVDRIPWNQSGDDKRIVLEPCSGSGVFLVGAMNVLRHQLFGATPAERHAYFTKHLAAVEKEAFGIEISRLALTLADFPNPDGWNIVRGDVFDSEELPSLLRRAGVVLCNPPFEDIELTDREKYQLQSVLKPAELLIRVLRDLHPSGVLGFVLPQRFIDRAGYKEVRRKLAERFAKIEITLLPDRAFDNADHDIALLVATDPVPHISCRIINRTVDDNKGAWRKFALTHGVSRESVAERSFDDAEISFAIPDLAEIWDFLKTNPTLDSCAALHRGIEWKSHLTEDGKETGNRSKLVRKSQSAGFMRGVAPRTSFNVFEKPEFHYLNMRPEEQSGGAYRLSWDRQKVIVNKARRSRGAWRMAAFPDNEGVTCYQTFIAIWPEKNCPDVWTLSAIINGPLANAFIATRQKRDINCEILRQLPMPYLSPPRAERIRSLVVEYLAAISQGLMSGSESQAERILKEIDAEVLNAYRLPPRMEHLLLEYFRGAERRTPFNFGAYLPEGEDVYFSLSDRLSPKFRESTAGALLKRMAIS